MSLEAHDPLKQHADYCTALPRQRHRLAPLGTLRALLAVWRSPDPVAAEARRVHELPDQQRERYLRRHGIDRY